MRFKRHAKSGTGDVQDFSFSKKLADVYAKFGSSLQCMVSFEFKSFQSTQVAWMFIRVLCALHVCGRINKSLCGPFLNLVPKE